MKRIKFLFVVAQFLVATTVLAGTEDATLDRPSFAASQTMKVSAVVEAIDHETREVTVRKPDDEVVTFTASDEARNLDQVSVGDVLIVEYTESVTIQVLANDGMEADAAKASVMARTKEGEMPGIAAMDSTIVVSTVEEINLETKTFKLKGPDGVVTEYLARNPDNLKRAMVGDLVVTTVTGTLAIVVEKAPTE